MVLNAWASFSLFPHLTAIQQDRDYQGLVQQDRDYQGLIQSVLGGTLMLLLHQSSPVQSSHWSCYC